MLSCILGLTNATGLVEADHTKLEKLGELDDAMSRFALGVTSLDIVYGVKLGIANGTSFGLRQHKLDCVSVRIGSTFNITR